MDKIKTPPTLEEMKDLLPDKTYLHYVDYNDNLNEKLDLVQEAIHIGDTSPLDQIIFDWEDCSECDPTDDYLDELKSDIADKYDMGEGDIDDLVDKHKENLKCVIEERDCSKPINDLLRHTGSEAMFYETGLSCEEACRKDSIRKERLKIKKHLGIKKSTWDKELDDMIGNAGYGGQLVVYFYKPVGDMIGGEAKTIRFKDPTIAIIDTGGGSGGDCELKGCVLDLPYSCKRIFIDRCVHYSYTHEVCGMVDNWCDNTRVEYPDVEPAVVWEEQESETEAHMLQEAKYNAVYAKGKCSFGDMNITRHRDTYYINDYPCGTKCPHCGTFWVD